MRASGPLRCRSFEVQTTDKKFLKIRSNMNDELREIVSICVQINCQLLTKSQLFNALMTMPREHFFAR